MSDVEQRLSDITQAYQKQQLTAARESLLMSFPRLKETEVYDRVLDRMSSLGSASDAKQRYDGDFTKLMTDAASLEIGSPVSQEDKQRVLDQKADRQAAQADVESPGKKPAAPTREELYDQVLNAIEDKDSEKAKRLGAMTKQ
jgi:hypothetical protein